MKIFIIISLTVSFLYLGDKEASLEKCQEKYSYGTCVELLY
jgi:hypothetical protein